MAVGKTEPHPEGASRQVPANATAGPAVSNAPVSQETWDDEQQSNNIVPLTRAEAEKMFGASVSRPSRVTPFGVVVAQMVLSLVATLVWWLMSNRPGAAALSAFLGGAVAWLPGALFAARMRYANGARSASAWVVGEAMKIGLTIAMFVAVALIFPKVDWVALLITYLIALKTYWVALAWR
jgi:ATP synthase protein I